MNNFLKDEGRPEGFPHSTAIPENHLEQILSSFVYVYSLKSKFKRRLTLLKVAPYFGLPRAEFRKLFELYCLERNELQGLSSEEGGEL